MQLISKYNKTSQKRYNLKILILFLLIQFLLATALIIFYRGPAEIIQTQHPKNIRVIWSGQTAKKLAALTFDDGPDPVYTPQVLDILKKYKIPATFFLVGNMAMSHPELVKREVAERHEIANHSFNHLYLQGKEPEFIEAEISETDSVLKEITGKISPWFRPPKGQIGHNILYAAARLNKTIVLWGFCLEHERQSSKEMVEAAVKAAAPGIILLAHDGLENRKKTIEALPEIIEAYQKMGYRFVTLTRLLKNLRR